MEEAKLTISDVDCVAFYEDPCLKLGRQIWTGSLPNASSQVRESVLRQMAGCKPQQAIHRITGYDGPIEIVDHHLSHAASSYFFSGFEQAAILTVDGVGDWPTTTYNVGSGNQIKRFEQVDFPDSLGLFYSAVTAYLGFEVNEGEYKVMGLAPYGRPVYLKEVQKLIDVTSEGNYCLNMKYFGFLHRDCMYSDELKDLLGIKPRKPGSEILQAHMDLAKTAQLILEEILLQKTRYLHDKVPTENLCMAGGVALNVVANSRCLREGPFKHLFVQPAAGDAGGSIGAAAIAYRRITQTGPPTARLSQVYLGPADSPSEIYRILGASSARFVDYRGAEETLIQYTVEQLVQGKVIAWFHGRMEFGPRSLGNRSILGDPRRPEMRDRINSQVKMRESFRPFAPAVLESLASEHFELDHPSPFMLETCRVTSAINLPAITHVDRSARIQTVSGDVNPRFAALLSEFYRRTGCPILLNTSFNLRGEPIVCTAVDAIACFVRSKIDILVIEDFVIERSGIPPLWMIYAAKGGMEGQNHEAAVEHNVYTLL